MYWSFLEVLIPNETYYVENIKSINFILGTNTKSTNLRIHELVIFNQATKIHTHEEKYFHSNWNIVESGINTINQPTLNTVALEFCHFYFSFYPQFLI